MGPVALAAIALIAATFALYWILRGMIAAGDWLGRQDFGADLCARGLHCWSEWKWAHGCGRTHHYRVQFRECTRWTKDWKKCRAQQHFPETEEQTEPHSGL